VWSPSDEALLAGLASGDAEAATAFVRRYQARVFGLALTIVGDRALAEEIAQETFLKAFQHAATFDPRRGKVVTWLLSVARHSAIDALRLRRAVPTDPDVLALLHAGVRAPGPDEAPVQADEAEALRRALAELPPEQRRALLLATFYGRTGREIAELEGAPLGTIKTRIRSALIKLRGALEVVHGG
jgi:RNA polymerase sigma-70 factor (ECF subfamily)